MIHQTKDYLSFIYWKETMKIRKPVGNSRLPC